MKNGIRTKAYAICYVMAVAAADGERLGRVDIMRRAHAFQTAIGMTLPAFKASSNSCYFSPTGRAAGGKSSVVFKGLVQPVGKCGRMLVYELTAAGKALASS